MPQDGGQLETTLRQLRSASRSALGRDALLAALPLGGLLANIGSFALIDAYELSDWAKSAPWFQQEINLGVLEWPLGYIVFDVALAAGSLLVAWLFCFLLQREDFAAGYSAASGLPGGPLAFSHPPLEQELRQAAGVLTGLKGQAAAGGKPPTLFALAWASLLGCIFVVPLGGLIGIPLCLALAVPALLRARARAAYHGCLAALCDLSA